jgi:hypothetical protein
MSPSDMSYTDIIQDRIVFVKYLLVVIELRVHAQVLDSGDPHPFEAERRGTMWWIVRESFLLFVQEWSSQEDSRLGPRRGFFLQM